MFQQSIIMCFFFIRRHQINNLFYGSAAENFDKLEKKKNPKNQFFIFIFSADMFSAFEIKNKIRKIFFLVFLGY